MSYGITPAPGHRNAYPGSFIGRQIAFFRVRFADTKDGSGKIDYDNYSTYLQIIQQQAEVILAGVPRVADTWGTFIVGVAFDTANTEANQSLARTITSLLQDFDGDAEFTRVWMVKNEWYEANDYLDYIDNNWPHTGSEIPNVYGHGSAEQEEFINMWINW
jgi:hypothetical protein